MINEHAEKVTRESREIIKAKYSDILASQGYTTIEEDECAHGYGWHENPNFGHQERTLGTVAFWKTKGKDGVIIRRMKSYEDIEDSRQSSSTITGTDVALVGDALPYFKKKAKYLGPILREQKEKIKVNNKKYDTTFLPYEVTELTLEELLG